MSKLKPGKARLHVQGRLAASGKGGNPFCLLPVSRAHSLPGMLERPWQYPPSEPPTPTSQEQKGGALRGSWRKAAAAGLCALKLEALRGQGGEHSSTEPPQLTNHPALPTWVPPEAPFLAQPVFGELICEVCWGLGRWGPATGWVGSRETQSLMLGSDTPSDASALPLLPLSTQGKSLPILLFKEK